MSPHAEEKKGTCHTDVIYTVETREGRGGDNPKTMLEYRTTRDSHAYGQQKTADCSGLPVLAQSMHWGRCTNEQSKMQGSADP